MRLVVVGCGIVGSACAYAAAGLGGPAPMTRSAPLTLPLR